MLYHLSFQKPLTHILQIEIQIPKNNASQKVLKLPRWRPGRYQFADFASKIYKVRAYVAGEAIPVARISSNEWQINCHPSAAVVVKYDYFAHALDGGGTYLDPYQLYINPINCLLYMDETLPKPCRLQVDTQVFSQIATSLQQENGGFFAPDYHTLVDSPLICSNTMEKYAFNVSGQDFNIWLQGNHAFDTDLLISDFIKYTQEQMRVLPMEKEVPFHYLIQIVPYRFYHGVEHAHSTTIVIGEENLHEKSLYENLLGVCSHELFHYWNIKRMRPQELLPYRYDQEVVFNTGYVVEGFTTYYGDLFLARSGVLTEDWFLEEINKKLLRHFQNGGRNHLSLLESSADLWVDGYQAGIPDRKVSIYNEGAIVALLLDLYLRKCTNQQTSLDNLVQEMWNKFGKTNTGYSHEAIVKLTSQLASREMDWFFEQYVSGCDPIDSLLGELAHWVGLSCEIIYPVGTWEKCLGVRFKQTAQGIQVAHIEKNSTASRYLSLDDLLLAIDDVEVTDHLPEIPEINRLDVKIKRFGNELTLTLPSNENGHLGAFQLEKNPNATEEQIFNRKKWISSQSGD